MKKTFQKHYMLVFNNVAVRTVIDDGTTVTGLYNYVARWYDPQTGHFTSADSIVQGRATITSTWLPTWTPSPIEKSSGGEYLITGSSSLIVGQELAVSSTLSCSLGGPFIAGLCGRAGFGVGYFGTDYLISKISDPFRENIAFPAIDNLLID